MNQTISVTTSLFEEAVEQVKAALHKDLQSRGATPVDEILSKGASDSVRHSYTLALDFHRKHPVTNQRSALLDRPNLPASTRKILEESNKKLAEHLATNRLAALISLFTISGVKHDLAERIVRADILTK